MIAEMILKETGNSWVIGVYIAALAIVLLIAVTMVPKTLQGVNLHPEKN